MQQATQRNIKLLLATSMLLTGGLALLVHAIGFEPGEVNPVMTSLSEPAHLPDLTQRPPAAPAAPRGNSDADYAQVLLMGADKDASASAENGIPAQ